MEITHANTDEADMLVELWLSLAAGQREHDSHLLVSENRTRIREAIVRHIVTDRLLVARDDGIQGLVMFAVENGDYEQDIRRGVIENLFVVPGNRNQGVGSELLDAAEQELAEQNVDAVALEVMAPNDDARRFYRAHGYEPHRVEFEKELATDSEDQ
jgi:ribosomal protein S18 acetylase RimI-like enzyme